MLSRFLNYLDSKKFHEEGILSRSYRENKELYEEIDSLLMNARKVFGNKLKKLTPLPQDNISWMTISTLWSDMFIDFSMAFRLFSMAYYKQGQATLRMAIENWFRILYLYDKPDKVKEFTEGKKWWAPLRQKELDKHYKDSFMKDRVKKVHQELSEAAHSIIFNEKNHRIYYYDYYEYNQERFVKGMKLIKKTYSLCNEMLDFELAAKSKFL